MEEGSRGASPPSGVARVRVVLGERIEWGWASSGFVWVFSISMAWMDGMVCGFLGVGLGWEVGLTYQVPTRWRAGCGD